LELNYLNLCSLKESKGIRTNVKVFFFFKALSFYYGFELHVFLFKAEAFSFVMTSTCKMSRPELLFLVWIELESGFGRCLCTSMQIFVTTLL